MALLYAPLTQEFEYEGKWEDVKVILWKGHCSVHEKFNVQHIENLRKQDSEITIIVHPECTFDVIQASDYAAGSTNYIIETIKQTPGSKWAIGTEMVG